MAATDISLSTLQEELASKENTSDKALILQKIGDYHIEDLAFDEAAKSYNEALDQLATETTESETKAEIQYRLSRAYALNGQLEEALQYAEHTLTLFQTLERYQDIPKTHRRIAVILSQLGKVEKSNFHFEQAEKTATERENWHELGALHGSIADINVVQGDHQVALESYQTAIDFYQKAEEFENVAQCYQTIAGLLVRHQKLTAAIQYYQTSADYFQQVGQYEDMGANFKQSARLLESKSEYVTSRDHYQKAVDAFCLASEAEQNNFEIGDAYAQIGYLHEGQKNWEAALECYQKAAVFATKSEAEQLIDMVADSIETCEEEIAKAAEKGKPSKKGGFFKRLFGG